VNIDRQYRMTTQEELAISFSGILHDIRKFIKETRKKRNSEDGLKLISLCLAEMFRGPGEDSLTDIRFLEDLVVNIKLAVKVECEEELEE